MKIAHKLSPEGLENKINDLVSYVNSESPNIKETFEVSNNQKISELVEIIMVMCASLASLKEFFEQ